MSAEIVNNTLSVGKDLIVYGKIQNPTVNGKLSITSEEDNPNHAMLEIKSSSGGELAFTDATSAANITSENGMALLAGSGRTDTSDTIAFGSAGVNSQMNLRTGKVGIGTTGPDATLHVAGN